MHPSPDRSLTIPLSGLYVICCPLCATATARTNYDGSDWCFNCMSCLTPALARNIIREGYNIEVCCVCVCVCCVFGCVCVCVCVCHSLPFQACYLKRTRLSSLNAKS